MDSAWYNMMSCVIFENLSVYYIVSVMWKYVVCKGNNIKDNPDQKSKCAYEGHYIMKHVDIWKQCI